MTTNARPAPAWDEETVAEAVRRAVAGVVVNVSNWPDGAQAALLGRDLSAPIDAITAAVLAVVREHLPVKPVREDIYRAWHGTDDPWGGCADRASIERVLDLWPGESRATVQAEALRAFADTRGVNVGDEDDEWWRGYRQAQRECLHDASARADRLAAEGGDDRG